MATSPHKSAAIAQLHSAYSLSYASKAARDTGAAALIAAALATDVGRIALQTDVNSFWIWTGVLFRHVAGPRPVKIVAGTAYTLLPEDLDATLETTNGSAVTITIPVVGSLVGINDGDGFEVVQTGAGVPTLAHASGSTKIKSSGSLTSKGQYAFLAAKYMPQVASDMWFVTGDRA